jgi:hypothetical protein
MDSAHDKRKYRRQPVNCQSIFSSSTARGEEGTVCDISVEGCRIAAPAAIAPDTTIELQIRPRTTPSIFVSRAVVRWAGESAFGVQFTTIAAHESNNLSRLLAAAAL